MAWKNRIGPSVLVRFYGIVRQQCKFQFRKMSDAATTVNISEHSASLLHGSSNSDSDSRKRTCSDDGSQEAKRPCLDAERVKRRKVALLLSYSGQGYLGMQRNPGTKTIEEDLLSALLKADLINEEAYQLPQSIHFQRAARTDKGVSAARQTVSLKLPTDGSIVDKINAYLPEQIRVMGIKRVTKGFNSKSSCDARTYSYMLPTFAFAPSSEQLTEEYRITEEVLTGVNDTLKVLEGTHNFHNFTSKKKPMDPSAHRYIMNFECGGPFVRDGIEFAVIKVKGQSFMLHQIRKMVGIAIAVARGLTTKDTIRKAWKTERLDIPVAPGLGLVLEEETRRNAQAFDQLPGPASERRKLVVMTLREGRKLAPKCVMCFLLFLLVSWRKVHYDKYNRRYGSDGIHDPLDWNDVEGAISKFKEEQIYPTIITTEKKEKSMMNWLLTLPFHSYDVRDENMSHGLAALGRAALALEEEENSGLTTLAMAAQLLDEQSKQDVVKKPLVEDDASVDSNAGSQDKDSQLICNGRKNILVEK